MKDFKLCGQNLFQTSVMRLALEGSTIKMFYNCMKRFLATVSQNLDCAQLI
jgi:hypothetical protein